MPMDLIPKPSCGGCGSTVELFSSACKHLTLCLICGKSLAEKRSKCCECCAPVTHLIREYNVGASSSSDKNYFIGRFTSRLPNFKKKNENKRSLQKEAMQGRQVTDTLRDDEDKDEGAEEGALTKWKELKKLLGRANGLNDSDSEDDDDTDDDTDSTEVDSSSPLKPTTSPAGRGTPSTSKPSKAKRKSKEPKTTPNGAPVKKVKTENEVTGPVTEDEIRAVLQKKPVSTLELVAIFKSRLQLKEDKDAFAATLRRISTMQKTNGATFAVLRNR